MPGDQDYTGQYKAAGIYSTVPTGVEITDTELVVIGEVLAQLTRVDCDTRQRIIRYLASRYGVQ